MDQNYEAVGPVGDLPPPPGTQAFGPNRAQTQFANAFGMFSYPRTYIQILTDVSGNDGGPVAVASARTDLRSGPRPSQPPKKAKTGKAAKKKAPEDNNNDTQDQDEEDDGDDGDEGGQEGVKKPKKAGFGRRANICLTIASIVLALSGIGIAFGIAGLALDI